MANNTAEFDTVTPVTSRYWGGWPTIGLSALILLGVGLAYAAAATAIGLFTQLGVRGLLADVFPFLAYVFPRTFGVPQNVATEAATDAMMQVYWLGAVAGLLLIRFVIDRRRGLDFAEYLDLRPIPHLALLPWLLVLFVYFGLFVVLPEITMARDGLSHGLSAGGTFFYFVTAVTMAPLFEEMLFRGFIFKGLAHSRLGVAGAIILTTAMWTSVHRHFTVEWFDELYGLGVIFGAGVIFAVARVRTGSLYTSIALHSVWNATLLLVDAMVFRRL
ncbi:MAG: CPBP family intramembrane metalloprotease [Alphaproteobacteria bacterium]|nr:CPBP family intramembrane metalloprotease [Alphaproteobacteria bacterium]